MESQNQNEVKLPEVIFPGVPIILAYDNIDRQEETLSGSVTSHRVNGILVQSQVGAYRLQYRRFQIKGRY